MLYLLLEWIRQEFNTPGFNVFRYLTFRAALAAGFSLLFCVVLGPKLIALLRRRQIGEAVKLDGPKSHFSKAGTPTMGGLILVGSLVVNTLLWADLRNPYILIICLATAWMCAVGFLDDYLKVIKKYPNGLIGRYKLVGQISLGLLVGVLLMYTPIYTDEVRTITTVPFVKSVNFDYQSPILYVLVVAFIITALSNAVNLTDGLDGLATGCAAAVVLTLGLICYVTGNIKFAGYLDIVYLRGAGELVIYAGATIGACLGFLWYNTFPAQVFMGDTGSLALGAGIGTLALLVKKELLLPVLGGIFLAEVLSVILQRSYFKYTKKTTGEGRRIFRMAPIHHHFEMMGTPESKIVTRFWIMALILALISLSTLKLR